LEKSGGLSNSRLAEAGEAVFSVFSVVLIIVYAEKTVEHLPPLPHFS
jgi:hypothetical protein